tara:strand:- start:1285 stop:2010 length:726 start_codon:yes stop_codon:yes gene_type:complete
MIPKISKTSKMPSESWSTRAWDTCPAKINLKTREVDDACKTCYARFGHYRMPTVEKAREHNERAWKDDIFVPYMVNYLEPHRLFRWFDSGDMYHIRLAEKIYEVCKQTEWCRHWIPTRMYKIDKFKDVIDRLNNLPNVVVRFSSPSIVGEVIEGRYTSTIIPSKDYKTKAKVCYAYLTDKKGRVWRAEDKERLTKEQIREQDFGHCGTCRSCWSKEEQTIAYVGHGQVMKSVLKKKGLIKG